MVSVGEPIIVTWQRIASGDQLTYKVDQLTIVTGRRADNDQVILGLGDDRKTILVEVEQNNRRNN